MELWISSAQQLQMLEWAAKAAPNECCGLILGHEAVVQTLELAANVANDPSLEFEIDPSALIAAEKYARHGGTPIIGYFHSHPNGVAKPSTQDANMAATDGRIWLIVAGGTVTAWEPIAASQHGLVTFVPAKLVVG